MPRCGRIKTSGEHAGQPCQAWALKDMEVCRKHGGASPNAKAGAVRRRSEREITSALGKLHVTPVHDPLTALAELAGEILAWKQLAADRVAKLEELARDNTVTGADEVRAEIMVFERALDRAVTVLATIARLNIDERLTAISEAQAALVKTALMGALGDSGVSKDQQREAAGHLARRLRVVAS